MKIKQFVCIHCGHKVNQPGLHRKCPVAMRGKCVYRLMLDSRSKEMLWRTGRKVLLNVYAGDRPVCQCHTTVDALEIVNAVNCYRAESENVRQVKQERDELLAALKSIQPFIEEERECRETSCLPEPTKDEEDYLQAAGDAVETVRAAVARIEKGEQA